MKAPSHNQIVYTDKAHCRDCYRCLRHCPVKAIRMIDGQAQEDPERCIACGTCIRECPQGAKRYRRDLARVQQWIQQGESVAVSLAPSFVASYDPAVHRRIPSALRKLGFVHIAETAIGAYHVAGQVAEQMQNDPQGHHVCTACPVVVGYIQRYAAPACSHLTPVVSPMVAHARLIRRNDARKPKVVFVGPCVAKKAEADRYSGDVAAALTFEELNEWLAEEAIDLLELEESQFDELPGGHARAFPVSGGLARTAQLDTDLLSVDVLATSGLTELNEVLDGLRQTDAPTVVDPLFCTQGCINGPAMASDLSLFERRRRVLDYANMSSNPQTPLPREAGLGTVYSDLSITEEPLEEQAIRDVLESIGKTTPEDELDCGACGYTSCREKAKAVLRGMAEPEMCIPFMRRLAEQRTDRIIETSPNGIVILDDQLRIVSMNPAFGKLFTCGNALLGKRISQLIDPEPFERVVTDEAGSLEKTIRYPNYNLLCRLLCYRLAEDRQIVGVFVNITQSDSSHEKLAKVREHTIHQARELMDNQIELAQKVASLLGQSTARGEEMLEHLIDLTQPVDTPER